VQALVATGRNQIVSTRTSSGIMEASYVDADFFSAMNDDLAIGIAI
jgi:hypothetical protein